jgi:hypothetical protein
LTTGGVTGGALHGSGSFQENLGADPGCTAASVAINAIGELTGTLTDNLALHWDFTLDLTSATSVTWTVQWELTGNPDAPPLVTVNGTDAGPFTGSLTMTDYDGLNSTTGPNLSGFQAKAFILPVQMSMTFQVNFLGTVGIDIPDHSIGVTGLSAIPEPGTIGLLGAGIAALAIGARQRRRTRDTRRDS